MSANVYVLASPTPTLYVYPSQLHPQPPTPGGSGPPFAYAYPLRRLDDDEHDRRRRRDETALVVLGAF